MDSMVIAGDVSSAATALSGLLLVFMGSVSTSFETYQKIEKRAVLHRFRLRVWFALIGLCVSIIAAIMALAAKANSWGFVAWLAFCALLIGFGFAIAAAIRAAMDVK